MTPAASLRLAISVLALAHAVVSQPVPIIATYFSQGCSYDPVSVSIVYSPASKLCSRACVACSLA